MKKLLPLLLAAGVSATCLAHDEQGFYVGGGIAATVVDDCGSYCDSKGALIEGGYFFNKIVGIDAKFARTERDKDDDITTDSTYLGVNVGHTFNTSWVRLYAKAGYYHSKIKYEYYRESVSDSNPALGIGVVITPLSHQSNLYIRLESIASEFRNADVGFANLTVGYQF